MKANSLIPIAIFMTFALLSIEDCVAVTPFQCHKNVCQNGGICFQVSNSLKSSWCKSGEVPFDRSCFFLNSRKLTWKKAREFCHSRNSTLVSINSLEQQKFLASIMQLTMFAQIPIIYVGTENIWTAGHLLTNDSEFQWIWDLEKQIPVELHKTEMFWQDRQSIFQTDKNCIALTARSRYKVWVPKNCSEKYLALCERPELDMGDAKGLYSYQCRCPLGFYGHYCEIKDSKLFAQLDHSDGKNILENSSKFDVVQSENSDGFVQFWSSKLNCNNERIVISCRNSELHNSTIVMDYAFYGITNIFTRYTRKYCDSNLFNGHSCLVENTLPKISHYCDGREDCHLPPLKKLFPVSPCQPTDTNFSLEYRFRCVKNNITCPLHMIQYNSTCYEIYDSQRNKDAATWEEARVLCLKSGGDLAGPLSDHENKVLFNKAHLPQFENVRFWIGLRAAPFIAPSLNAEFPWTVRSYSNPSELFEDETLSTNPKLQWTNGVSLNSTKLLANITEKAEGCVAMTVRCNSSKNCGIVWILEDCNMKLNFICQASAGNLYRRKWLHLPEEKQSLDISKINNSLKCSPVNVRSIQWPSVHVGKSVKMPCPNGTIGYAIWSCVNINGNIRFYPENPDLSNCSHPWFSDIDEMIYSKNSIFKVIRMVEKNVELTDQLYGGDLKKIVDLLQTLITIFPKQLNENVATFSNDTFQRGSIKNFSYEIAKLSNFLIDKKILDVWKDLQQKDKHNAASTLMGNVENLTHYFGDSLLKFDGFSLSFKNLDMTFEVTRPLLGNHKLRKRYANNDRKLGARFVSSTKLASILLPVNAMLKTISKEIEATTVFFARTASDSMPPKIPTVSFGYFAYKDGLTNLLQPAKDVNNDAGQKFINSEIVGACVNYPSSLRTLESAPAIIKLSHIKQDRVKNPRCVYWNVIERKWDTNGCSINESTPEYTVCSCHHLTSFAILMDFVGFSDDLTPRNKQAMSLLSMLACSFSCTCLVFCIIVFSCFRSLRGARTTIHLNLCICLLIGQLLFVFGVGQAKNEILCRSVAAFLHFFFLAAFCWMLAEGYQLYVMLVKVFDDKNNWSFSQHLLVYGMPMVIVAISLWLDFNSYGTQDYCWINLHSSTIWAFVGPVIVVIFSNICVIGLALKTVFSVASGQNRSHSQIILGWLRGSAMLLCLLGITWGVGLFVAVQPLGYISSYLFTVLNGSQGIFIFVFHVILNDKARTALSRWMKKHVPMFTFSSTNNQHVPFSGTKSLKTSSNLKTSKSTGSTDLNAKKAEENEQINRTSLEFKNRNAFTYNRPASSISTFNADFAKATYRPCARLQEIAKKSSTSNF
ncbi:Latrophilin-like protein LAT-2 [Trichinella pseudospiralis]|uniref:Latrophilin-like protein LAT-2 n=1 Tax=Trichinella pseudospiralis TaxID=6337 RepID=A0A0V1IHF5_TRIPS|nr:Latrophilin-like protein LAT-2 [Trichinella pseudospiralis]